MAKKVLFPALRSNLYVMLHSGAGQPVAFRLNTVKLLGLSTAIFISALVLFVGTLMFFRELEMNRKLLSRVIELETREKLWQAVPRPPEKPLPTETKTEMTVSSSAEVSKEAVQAQPVREPAKAAPVAQAASVVPTPAPAPTTSQIVQAKLSDVTATCEGEGCLVKVAMMTLSPGTSEGSLLIVLETALPVIGSGNPTQNVRKRYFLYPGMESRDELSQAELPKLAKKAFRFSRVLQTNANFSIGKLLRPLAVNAYLFDSNRSLVEHQRKTIGEENP